MLAVTLTIGTLVSVMFFFVGGMVGWLAKEHVYNTQPVYTHPEMFDETVISVLPVGDVPYNKNEVPVGTDHTSLRREYKHLYNFVKGGNDGLSGLRRETMFIQMLEGLHPEEAEILCLCKDKKLADKYKITYDIVKQAFPDIQWGGRS